MFKQEVKEYVLSVFDQYYERNPSFPDEGFNIEVYPEKGKCLASVEVGQASEVELFSFPVLIGVYSPEEVRKLTIALRDIMLIVDKEWGGQLVLTQLDICYIHIVDDWYASVTLVPRIS